MGRARHHRPPPPHRDAVHSVMPFSRACRLSPKSRKVDSVSHGSGDAAKAAQSAAVSLFPTLPTPCTTTIFPLITFPSRSWKRTVGRTRLVAKLVLLGQRRPLLTTQTTCNHRRPTPMPIRPASEPPTRADPSRKHRTHKRHLSRIKRGEIALESKRCGARIVVNGRRSSSSIVSLF